MKPEARDSIVVPLDGRESSLAALPVAAAIAKVEDATLHVVHVTEREPTSRELLAQLHLHPRALERAVVERLRGPPAEAILEVATRTAAKHIVLCTHTASERARDELGRVTEQVLHEAPCPVVLVRPDQGTGPFHLRTLLFPHDGTPTSTAALEPITDLARRAGARLHVLHVATAARPGADERGTLSVPRYLDQPQHEWPSWSKEFLQRMSSSAELPEGLQLHLTHGIPEEEILDFAEANQADLVLVAWRGRLEEKRARVVKAALFQGRCPVMVMRVS